MKRFRFPLERVRCWRAEQASAEELKLEQLRAELDRLARERRRVEMEALQASAEVLARPSLDALELTSLDAYRLHLRQRVREIDYRRAQRTQQIAEQRQRVIEARRQAELLDRLHDQAWKAWSAASDKEQETLAADLFLAKAVRERR